MAKEKIKELGIQMTHLDDFVTRACLENAEHHSHYAYSMAKLSDTVKT